MKDTAFIGNDINDIALMKEVGYPFCPSDAHRDVFEYAQSLENTGRQGYSQRIKVIRLKKKLK